MHKKFTALLAVGLLPLLTFAAKPLFNVGSADEVKAGPYDNTTIISRYGKKMQLELKKGGTRYQGVILTPVKEKFFDLFQF